MEIAMTEREVALLDAMLAASRDYLEFGSGGSTCKAYALVKNRVISVDSSSEWLSKVREEVTVIDRHRGPEVHLFHANIGPTKDWGYPSDEANKHLWSSYTQDVWQIEGANQSDLYLVDGRFRVCCFAEIVLRAPNGSLIMMHDFGSRPSYHIIHSFARRIALVEDLSVFVKDGNSDLRIAAETAAKYRFVPH